MKGRKRKKQPKYSVFATQGQGSICLGTNLRSYDVKKLVAQHAGNCSLGVQRDDGEWVTEKFV